MKNLRVCLIDMECITYKRKYFPYFKKNKNIHSQRKNFLYFQWKKNSNQILQSRILGEKLIFFMKNKCNQIRQYFISEPSTFALQPPKTSVLKDVMYSVVWRPSNELRERRRKKSFLILIFNKPKNYLIIKNNTY